MSAETSSGPLPASNTQPRSFLRLMFVLPALAFVAVAAGFAVGLTRDPQKVPSALIGKPVPEFRLPPVQGRALGLASADLHGQVSLVNVFASWCVPCRTEAPLLLRLKQQGTVPIHGLDYKDAPADAAKFLDTFGDPFTRTGADLDGRVAIDWGVYGVPETFVIGADGRIVHKHTGALTVRDLDETILPLVTKLQPRQATRSNNATR